MDISVIEIDYSVSNTQYLKILEFDVDGGKQFCYRSRVSYAAFSNILRKRYYNKKSQLLYECRSKHEHDIKVKIWLDMITRHPNIFNIYNIPTVRINSLWEFYDYIRYDYKNKKYY